MKADSNRFAILQTPAGVIVVLTLLGVTAYTAWILSDYYSQQADLTVAGVGLTLLLLILAGFAVAVALRGGFNMHIRRGWLLISLGGLSLALSYAIGFAGRIVPEVGLSPTSADIFHSAYYPLVFLGLLLFPAALVALQQRSVLYLDLVILVLGFSMVYWYLLPAPPGAALDPDLKSLWSMAYPIGDFLLLAAVIALTQRDLARPARWMLLYIAYGMICATVADLFFAYFQMSGIAYEPAYLNALWMCSGQFLCLAAAKQINMGTSALVDPPLKSSPTLYLLRLVLPYLAVGLSLGLLVWVVLIDRESGIRLSGILFGAVIMVVLVLLRQYLVLKENLRLYQAVQRIAWTDGLTGLYNRHFFNEMLPREMERARRYKGNLSVLLLDLNGFKKYNDTYGHLEGDVVLKSVAIVCAGQLRSSDTIARFGGDEFVIILPSASRRVAQKIAGRIQSVLSENSFHGNKLGVTIGISVYRDGLSPQGLLEEADQDLYRHKANNGNG